VGERRAYAEDVLPEDVQRDGWRRIWPRYEQELQLASDAADRAARHEERASDAPESLRALHLRMATVHRRAEQRHLAAAKLHRLTASRMAGLLPRVDEAVAPEILAAIASMVGSTSALAVLRGQGVVAAVRASDEIAQSAYDLEALLAEGPALEAARTGNSVVAGGTELTERWPRYGPEIAALGVASVMAAPLGPPAARVGALCTLSQVPSIQRDGPVTLRALGAALSYILVTSADMHDQFDLGVTPVFSADDSLARFNQAVGMVSVQCDCSLKDAADLIAARAFASGYSLAEVAGQVLSGDLKLADP
jgi:hypothetical protein